MDLCIVGPMKLVRRFTLAFEDDSVDSLWSSLLLMRTRQQPAISRLSNRPERCYANDLAQSNSTF